MYIKICTYKNIHEEKKIKINQSKVGTSNRKCFGTIIACALETS